VARPGCEAGLLSDLEHQIDIMPFTVEHPYRVGVLAPLTADSPCIVRTWLHPVRIDVQFCAWSFRLAAVGALSP
jgi:hypothetical protein